jgi:adenylate kinase family enzyme
VKSRSALGKELDAKMSEGKLISSDIMVNLVLKTIERNNYGGRYLLDGFPRGQENIEVWDKIMAKSVNLKSVIYFECAEEELKRRLLERGKTSGRSDDNESSIAKRLKVFNDETAPVISKYSA